MKPDVVVKVGGSLFDLPELGARLAAWLGALGAAAPLLVPGGGPTADAVRALDRALGLGEETSHWLALRAVALNAHAFAAVLPGAEVVDGLPAAVGCWARRRLPLLDAHAFCRADERDDPSAALPHTWDVTSDSVAARVAVAWGATRLVLLKSAPGPADGDWIAAARRGYVDGHLPAVIAKAGGSLAVSAVDLRSNSRAARN